MDGKDSDAARDGKRRCSIEVDQAFEALRIITTDVVKKKKLINTKFAFLPFSFNFKEAAIKKVFEFKTLLIAASLLNSGKKSPFCV